MKSWVKLNLCFILSFTYKITNLANVTVLFSINTILHQMLINGFNFILPKQFDIMINVLCGSLL